MSPKSLVAAKALGGGVLGGGSIVGAGYGITKYFKSEESNTSDQSSQATTEIVTEEVPYTTIPEAPSEERRDNGTPDNVGNTQEVSSPGKTLEGGITAQQGDSQLSTSPGQPESDPSTPTSKDGGSVSVEGPKKPGTEDVGETGHQNN